MRISDWSSDVCSSDLRIAGSFQFHQSNVAPVILVQHLSDHAAGQEADTKEALHADDMLVGHDQSVVADDESRIVSFSHFDQDGGAAKMVDLSVNDAGKKPQIGRA